MSKLIKFPSTEPSRVVLEQMKAGFAKEMKTLKKAGKQLVTGAFFCLAAYGYLRTVTKDPFDCLSALMCVSLGCILLYKSGETFGELK